VLTLNLCVLYGSQNKRQLLPYKTLRDWFCITEVDSVYSAVRTESLYKTDTFVFKGLKKTLGKPEINYLYSFVGGKRLTFTAVLYVGL
jgi:hypothetical protein